MRLGDRVRRHSTGEHGVILGVEGDFLEVSFASGKVHIHSDEVAPLGGDPHELLAAGTVGDGLPYALRLQALFLKHAYRYDELTGLSNARIEPELHQVFIAHRVTNKLQPRMLLADEVGLGKTIEAGLIIKELGARQVLSRVLIVCPANLQYQWQQEMRSKFNEDFEIIDGAGAKFLGRGGVNPWAKLDKVICSISFASNPKQADQIVEAGWDLAVFDEAHRVRRRYESAKKISTTRAYRFADELKESVNGLLLLTATPMQLHPYELYSLIELVEPGLLDSFAEYESRRKSLPQLNSLMKVLQGWDARSLEDQNAEVDKHLSLLADLGISGKTALSVLADLGRREELMDDLVKRHPLSGVLVRNRKAEIGGYSSRVAHQRLVELADDELNLYKEVGTYIRQGYGSAQVDRNMAVGFLMVTYQKMLASSSNAIRQSFRRRAQRLRIQLRDQDDASRKSLGAQGLDSLRESYEVSDALVDLEGATQSDAELIRQEIEHLESMVDALGKVRDSKTAKLLALVDQLLEEGPAEKILIFTQFIDTQEYLAHALEYQGFRVARFNGKMSLDEKEDQVRKFRDDIQILISTEAGGEGRNFQFCHLLINYDLPWNPMKVEQRIGRLDRIGQTHAVHIFNLVCRNTVEERVVSVLQNRIRLFEESVGSLDPILGEVEREIENLVMSDNDAEFEKYEKDIDQRVREAKERERTLADFVLDRSSLRRDQANELLERSPLARWSDLQNFAGAALEYYGGTLKEHADGGEVIALSSRLGSLLKTRHSTFRGTFEPQTAREREDLPFFALGHDVVDSIVDLCASDAADATGCRRLPGQVDGTWVEIFYELEGQGVQSSGRLIRHLVNGNMEVRSTEVDQIPALGEQVKIPVPDWAREAVDASRLRFEKEHSQYRERIREEHADRRKKELHRSERIFRYRETRLSRMVDEQAKWIEEKEVAATERERRVLPARKGQLAKRQEELERLKFDYEAAIAAIGFRDASASARVLAAGLVVG